MTPGIADAGGDPEPPLARRENGGGKRAEADQQDRHDRAVPPADQRRDRDGAGAGRQHQRIARPDHQREPFPQHGDGGDSPEHRERPVAEPGDRNRERRQHERRKQCAIPDYATARTRGFRRCRGLTQDRSRSRISGSGLGDQAAETALALLVFADRGFERGAVEIRPIGRHEYQFAIGRLPQQEIRQPLLAAGADDQIGIGQIGRVEKTADRFGRDVGRREVALRPLAERCGAPRA